MELFVNRETELQLIDESFTALVDGKRLLRTPFIEVQGVGGIGKTSLLKQVELRCHDTQLPYIWIDVNQSALQIAHEINKQVKKYLQDEEASDTLLEQSPVDTTKVLLRQKPVVMLFDSVDMASTEQLDMIEDLLKDLLDDERLFVILASKKALLFQRERSVARKLTSLPLQPLDRANCELYLDRLNSSINPEVRNLIFEWTRGYPLAMNVMAQATNNGLDPRTEQGQQEALALLTEKVINQEVLQYVKTEERSRYFSALQLFSVPRRFNLGIMQDLIEKFAPELKRNSSLAYFSLPKDITDTTHVLSWSMLRAGFSVDGPVRNIFLLLLRIEQPQRYLAIHGFLAQVNLNLAQQFPGFDRVRYIRECLYHTACDTSSSHLSTLLAQAMQIILQEPLETFQQFLEEFSLDDDLKEALGKHLTTIQTMLDTYNRGTLGG